MPKKKKKKKSQKKITAPNMAAFIKTQQQRTKPHDEAVMIALKELIDEAFESGSELPVTSAVAERADLSYDITHKILKKLQKHGKIVDVAVGIPTRFYVPNEPEYTEGIE